MLLPGPEAQQLATFVGWRLHGVRGAWRRACCSCCRARWSCWRSPGSPPARGDVPTVAAVFDGIKPAVVAIIAAALWRIGRKTLDGWAPMAMAAAAFVGLAFLNLPFPLIVLGAGAIGWAVGRTGKKKKKKDRSSLAPLPAARPPPIPTSPLAPAERRRLIRLAATFLALWAVPVGLVVLALGPEPWAGVAWLFTKAAFRHLRGSLRGAALHRRPGRRGLRMAAAGGDDPRPRAGRNHARTADPFPLCVTQFVGFFAGWTLRRRHGARPRGDDRPRR